MENRFNAHEEKMRNLREMLKRKQNVKNEVKIIQNDQNNDRKNTDEEETQKGVSWKEKGENKRKREEEERKQEKNRDYKT